MSEARPANILEAMLAPDWWGNWFSGEEWRPWRVFVSAVFGLPMEERRDRQFFRSCTGLTRPPKERAREVWAIVGRRGGKTRTLAFVATYLAVFVDWSPRLAPGEKAAILVLAKDRSQAQVAFSYLASFFDHPALRPLISAEGSDYIELSNQVTISVATASFRSLRGRTVAAVLADEMSFWMDGSESANPAEEVIVSLRPAMLTMPGSLLMVATSPYAKRGPVYDSFRKFWAVPGRRLVWRATTIEMHPSIIDDPDAVAQMAEERADDPAKAAAEYDAQFRDDVEARQLVDAAGVIEQANTAISKAGGRLKVDIGTHMLTTVVRDSASRERILGPKLGEVIASDGRNAVSACDLDDGGGGFVGRRARRVFE